MIRMVVRIMAAVGFLALALFSVTAAANNHVVATIPIQFVGNHIYADARVNGSGPYRFVVDTGGVNLITPALQKKLGLPLLGHEVGHGVGAKSVDSGKTLVRELAVGGHTFQKQKFFTYDLGKLYASGGVRMQGMAGIAVFRHYVMRIDCASRTIELIDPKSFEAPQGSEAVPLTIVGNELHVPASFDGFKGSFVIDTGSASTLTLDSPFVAEHGLMARFPNGLRTVGGGVGGGTHSYTVRGRDLRIGNKTITRPVVEFSTDKAGNFSRADVAGYIGMGALKRFVVTFDFDKHRMYLEPIRIADLDTYDRSGMSLNVTADGFLVTNVILHSPAAESGVRVGDVILGVDNKPAAAYSLPGIRKMLRLEAPGTMLHLTLMTPEGERKVQITLRRLL